jgi:hypothetical protein
MKTCFFGWVLLELGKYTATETINMISLRQKISWGLTT